MDLAFLASEPQKPCLGSFKFFIEVYSYDLASLAKNWELELGLGLRLRLGLGYLKDDVVVGTARWPAYAEERDASRYADEARNAFAASVDEDEDGGEEEDEEEEEFRYQSISSPEIEVAGFKESSSSTPGLDCRCLLLYAIYAHPKTLTTFVSRESAKFATRNEGIRRENPLSLSLL